ncbi:MAG TPA: ferritin-like domain-containing protein [Mycobacteriales bacterium]|nr:ferritin-like domain-containing protein [Mycobacteriales bacterium]
MTAPTGQVPALQAALAAEHAVIWGYSVVGARAGDELRPRVRDADDAHRTRRDGTVTLIEKYGGAPVPTESSYALPFPVTDRASALRLAVHLEDGAAAAWRYAVAATDDVAVRRTALTALTDAAVRATRWRLVVPTKVATLAFPGD